MAYTSRKQAARKKRGNVWIWVALFVALATHLILTLTTEWEVPDQDATVHVEERRD